MAADSRSEFEKSTASNVNADSDMSSYGGSGDGTGAMSDRTVARLKFASAIMGVLIILCLILLVYGVSQKAGELSKKDTATPVLVSDLPIAQANPLELPERLDLPAGMKVQSIASTADGGLWLFANASDTQYLLRMSASGQLIQTMELRAAD